MRAPSIPDLPSGNLVEHIVKLADEEFLARLDEILRARFFVQLARRALSIEKRAEAAQGMLFAEIREQAMKLPARLSVGKGRRVTRENLTYEDLKRRLAVLTAQSRDRFKNSREVAAVKALMKLWPTRSKTLQGLTLAEVDRRKAERAGLIG